MGVDVSNILQGPCNVYLAAFGATEPAPGTWTEMDSGIWTNAGGTNGGVKLNVNTTFKTLEVDQVPDPVGVRMTARDVTVETELSEITLTNIKFLMNGGTITNGGTTVGSTWTI